MADSWTFNDFSAGWIPSDDALAGRKNGFLRMQNVELDQLGAVVMSQSAIASAVPGAALPVNAHTLFSKFIGGNRSRYFALVDGSVTRNGTPNVITGGSISRAGFGVSFRYTLICTGSQKKKDDGTTIFNLGIDEPNVAPVVALNAAAGNLDGDYTYIQINVSANGAYLGRSPKSPTSVAVTTALQQIDVTPQNPNVVSTEANQAWIFRRGGTLDQYYRVSVRDAGTGFGLFTDNLSDQDAIALNITLSEFTNAINDITDDIIEIVGPVNKRTIYFTNRQIFFSEIDSPDSYDRRAVMNITSNMSEQFLWAKLVDENLILIGTTLQCYALVGNFIQFPDGFMDVYLRSLNTSTPPLGIDAAVFEHSVIYESAFGWVQMNAEGAVTPLINNSVDRLYRGQQCYGYSGVPGYQYPAGGDKVRYPCAMSRNKLWVSYPTIDHSNLSSANFGIRMDVYDFAKQYWRTTEYKPNILYSEEDDNIMGFFPADKFIRDFDFWPRSDKLIDGTTKQTIDLLTPIFDFNLPRNRKDLYTIKLKVFTAGDPITLTALVNNANVSVNLGTFSNGVGGELILDVSSFFTDNNPIKNIQLQFTGQVLDFYLSFITFEFDARPMQLPAMRIPEQNFGHAGRKRVSMIPFVMDTLGNTVQIDCYVDGLLNTSHTYITTRKQVCEFQFDPPAIGKDFEFVFDTIACVTTDGTFNPSVAACQSLLFTPPVDPAVKALCLGGALTYGIDICPLQSTTLLSDSFSAYTAGLELPLGGLPYTRRDGTGGGVLITATPSVPAMEATFLPSFTVPGLDAWSVYIFQASLADTKCGFWAELKFIQNVNNPFPSHGTAGFALGMTENSADVNWIGLTMGHINGGGTSSIFQKTNNGTGQTLLISPGIGDANTNQIMRLEIIGPDRKTLRFIRMDAARVVLASSQVFLGTAVPGTKCGLMAQWPGGSGGVGITGSWRWNSFAMGVM